MLQPLIIKACGASSLFIPQGKPCLCRVKTPVANFIIQIKGLYT